MVDFITALYRPKYLVERRENLIIPTNYLLHTHKKQISGAKYLNFTGFKEIYVTFSDNAKHWVSELSRNDT